MHICIYPLHPDTVHVDQVVSLSMVMIIEFLTPTIYDRSVTSFNWNEGRLEVDHAVMNLPKLLKERYFPSIVYHIIKLVHGVESINHNLSFNQTFLYMI